MTIHVKKKRDQVQYLIKMFQDFSLILWKIEVNFVITF